VKPYFETDSGVIYHGDVLEVLKQLSDESIHCCVTSPPYWGLRDYKIDGQLGLEKTPEEYVLKMVEVFSEVKRVLRGDGTLWLNMGDSYAGGGRAGKNGQAYGGLEARDRCNTQVKWGAPTGKLEGLKPKDLIGIPWRVAFALQADGWYLRSDIIWCLSGGTKVYAQTQKGVMPTNLKDLYRLKPETVELWNGEKWTRLKGMSKSPRKGDEIELVLRSGERISCTPNHKWPTDNGLKEAKDLKVGDILKRCFLPDSGNSEFRHIPNEIGWFIGTYLADGSRDTSGTIQIASHIKEQRRFSRLSQYAESYGGTCRKHNTSDNGMTICMDGKILNAVLDTYIAGKTAKDKHLSNACWQRNNYFLEYLLNGYLEGDGHWDQINKRWRLGFTRNDYLEQDLRTLCSRLAANLTLKLSESKIKDKIYKSYRGEIRFEKMAKGHWNQKNKNGIIKIRKARARYFYNVGVEDDPHVFALASGVLTHNSKPNPMPESVTDRPTKAHEYLFLLTKSAKYYYDADAIREKHSNSHHNGNRHEYDTKPTMGAGGLKGVAVGNHVNGRNKRTVWTIPTQPMPQAHFATFPEKLIEPCILAGTSEKGCCVECGAPWERVVEKIDTGKTQKMADGWDTGVGGHNTIHRDGREKGEPNKMVTESKTIGWQPTCKCDAKPSPCTVLDLFGGSMTVAVVACKHSRKFTMIELSQTYIEDIGIPRINKETQQLKLF